MLCALIMIMAHRLHKERAAAARNKHYKSSLRSLVKKSRQSAQLSPNDEKLLMQLARKLHFKQNKLSRIQSRLKKACCNTGVKNAKNT